jgi:hypothetical protein
MTIRPQDLLDRRFRLAFRGAARWEVRELLKALADDYGSTLAEVDRLRAELASAGSRLVAARDHEREATRLLSQAEDAARKVREEAERAAAEATARAEGTLAAMLRELEAERALLDGRIAECLERQQRAEALLQTQADELSAFLATEPAFDTGAVGIESPMPEPPTLESPVVESPVSADAAADPDESPFSAAEVSQAFAVATGQHAPPLPDLASGDPRGFEFEALPEWAAPASSPELEPPLEPAASPAGRRLIPAGLAAAVIVSALASPGSSPAPHSPHDTPQPATAARSEPAAARRQPVPATVSLAAPTAPSASSAPETPPRAAPLPPGTLRVSVEAVRPCWIRLTSDGRSVERELSAGETITRDSTTDVVIRAGNAGALVVTLNGRTLPPLGREGEIVTRRLPLAMAAQ